MGERCMCGAGDCPYCFPSTYKAYQAWDQGLFDDEADLDDHEEEEEDEDIVRYREEGRER
jgi:hypothetical protein